MPVAMIVYTAWWQSENPDKLRSTSSLEFIFGPLWVSLGALAGLYVGAWLRDRLSKG